MAIKGFEILLWFLIIPLAAGNLPVFETGKEKDWFVRMADAHLRLCSAVCSI